MRTVVILFLVVIFCLSCTEMNSDDPEVIQKAKVAMPMKYGDNVYYFDCNYLYCNQADFGKSLQLFISSNPKLEIVTVTSCNTGKHGTTNGYFVVVRTIRSQE